MRVRASARATADSQPILTLFEYSNNDAFYYYLVNHNYPTLALKYYNYVLFYVYKLLPLLLLKYCDCFY